MITTVLYVSADANAARFLVRRSDKDASRLETTQMNNLLRLFILIVHIGVLYMAMTSSNNSYLAFYVILPHVQYVCEAGSNDWHDKFHAELRIRNPHALKNSMTRFRNRVLSSPQNTPFINSRFCEWRKRDVFLIIAI